MTAAEERDVFWGFRDIALFVGLACIAAAAAVLAVKPFHIRSKGVEALTAQFLLYVLLFFGLLLLFKVQYDRPFWRSLGFGRARGFLWAVPAGAALAFGISLLGVAMHTPDLDTPMRQLLGDPAALALLAIFGSTLGPLFEEMAFRGFFQPLLVRSLGAAPGIAAAALPFGLLHLPQYGNSWRHGLLITLAGAAFGWTRHRTGSTFASTLMHAAYNSTFFLALFQESPRSW